LSYINNLHPKTHVRLYTVLEQIIAKAIPLWNQTLTQITNERNIRPRVEVQGDGYGESYSFPEFPDSQDDETPEEYERKYDEYERLLNAHVVQPEPMEFKPPSQRIRSKAVQDPVDPIYMEVREDDLEDLGIYPDAPESDPEDIESNPEDRKAGKWSSLTSTPIPSPSQSSSSSLLLNNRTQRT
jgi:hypothetical protein